VDQECRKKGRTSLAAKSAELGCRSIDGAYLLAGTSRHSASAMAGRVRGRAAADAHVVHAELRGPATANCRHPNRVGS